MTSPEIRFNRPDITESDRAFLADAIRGGHSSGNGVFTQRAETLLQDTPGTNRALLTTSCTHALEMSALLCNLAPDDEVIVPSYTFVSSASAFAMFGAKPVFVDSRRDTLNIDANLIEQAITPRTKAICIVHYGGAVSEPFGRWLHRVFMKQRTSHAARVARCSSMTKGLLSVPKSCEIRAPIAVNSCAARSTNTHGWISAQAGC